MDDYTDLTRTNQPETRDKLTGDRADWPFYAYMARLKYITRWALMRNSSAENVQEHSHMTAVLAHALALISRNVYGNQTVSPDRCAAAALFHDAGEILTGDMPTPVKYYNPDIRAEYKKVEDVAADALLNMLPAELREDYVPLLHESDAETARFVKAADKLSAYIKCLEELRASNQEFLLAARQTRQALDDMDMPELRYFLSHFISSFTLTLDELG